MCAGTRAVFLPFIVLSTKRLLFSEFKGQGGGATVKVFAGRLFISSDLVAGVRKADLGHSIATSPLGSDRKR